MSACEAAATPFDELQPAPRDPAQDVSIHETRFESRLHNHSHSLPGILSGSLSLFTHTNVSPDAHLRPDRLPRTGPWERVHLHVLPPPSCMFGYGGEVGVRDATKLNALLSSALVPRWQFNVNVNVLCSCGNHFHQIFHPPVTNFSESAFVRNCDARRFTVWTPTQSH